jgi:hypothetical protein
MKKAKTYSDITKPMLVDDILKNFDAKVLELNKLLEHISQNDTQNKEKRFIDTKILLKAIKEFKRIKDSNLDNEVLAYATRNMFELNMIYQYTCINNDNLREWIGNKAQDEIEIYEGILKISEKPNSIEEKIIKDRIDHIKALAQKHNYKLSKQLTTKTLSERVGLVKEYDGLFKLYSKFVHPTSWLINSKDEEINSLQYKNIFLIQFQTYLYDLESRLHDFYK